jgi:hypothetical protein
MRLCIREGAPESLVIDGIYGRSGNYLRCEGYLRGKKL